MTYDEARRFLAPVYEFLAASRRRAEPTTYTDAEIALKQERLAEIERVEKIIGQTMNALSGVK